MLLWFHQPSRGQAGPRSPFSPVLPSFKESVQPWGNATLPIASRARANRYAKQIGSWKEICYP